MQTSFFSKYRELTSSLILASLFLLFLTSCESGKTIVHGLDEKEANEIVVLLSSKGIDAQKIQSAEAATGGTKVTLWDIRVGAGDATQASALLNMNGLPRRRGQNLLGIFSKGGLVPSDREEKIRYQAGLAEQIASTIRKIDGVLDADVQLSFPEEETLLPNSPKKEKVTASVYVKHSGVLDDPNSHLVTKIRRLIASSINGLDFDNVTVIADRARFSELPDNVRIGDAQKPFINVWSIFVAKESLGRFQFIFFSFIILLILLILALGWICWKIYPLVKKIGLKPFFTHVNPITPEQFHEVPPEPVVENEPEEKV